MILIYAFLVFSLVSTDVRPANASSIGEYGELKASPSRYIAPRINPERLATAWKASDFYYISTQLSPAVLFHNKAGEFKLFADLSKWGLGGPSYCAVPAGGRCDVLRIGETREGQVMSEPWLLVWFAGSEGWTDWDSPWLVVLQHRPKTIALAKNGLNQYHMTHPSSYGRGRDVSHIAPSMERIRSLLLNETPEKLARIALGGNWELSPGSSAVAFGMSFIRTSVPVRFKRLIPA
ncbi:MAG: hypothetical protein ACP5R4_13670, partial [Armatimonadota bacterium]